MYSLWKHNPGNPSTWLAGAYDKDLLLEIAAASFSDLDGLYIMKGDHFLHWINNEPNN